MAQFSVNTARFDPYRNFKFKIKWSVDRAGQLVPMVRSGETWTVTSSLRRPRFSGSS